MSASSQNTSTVVQIAFDTNPTPHHCGYCDTNGSCSAGLCFLTNINLRKVRSSNCGYCKTENGKISFGIVASTMLIDDYQALMDRGWRKCGTYYYKALMNKTCCPLYTIRCDAKKFKISRSQRKVVQLMNQFINFNIKPDQKTTNSQTNPSMTVRQWIETSTNTRAKQLTQYLLTQNTLPTDDLLKTLSSRQKRWYKKLLKLKTANKLSFDTDINLLIKRYNRMPNNSSTTLEQLLQFNENSSNKLEFRLVRSYPPSAEFTQTLTESHSIYKRYQMAIHHDDESECTLSQFKRFLCQSSLLKDSPRISAAQTPSCGYGCFHLQYYLNKKLIACSVIDILSGGISAVYFYYEPDLGFLKLGVYSALKEIELTRKLLHEIPNIRYYYLGFYVHSCVKMRYKGQYKPSYLLCPETYTWHSIEKCIPLLNQKKYSRFESDLSKVDTNEETNINNLKLRVSNRIMTPIELQNMNENYFYYILERFVMLAKFIGQTCANRIIIDLK